ncbi:MAG: hypothetical protein ACRCS9_13885 [Hyphomicrobium sp.]
MNGEANGQTYDDRDLAERKRAAEQRHVAEMARIEKLNEETAATAGAEPAPAPHSPLSTPEPEPQAQPLPPFVLDVMQEVTALGNMLIQKNAAYGNSALDPVRIFSRADTVEQLKVRIDDKIARMMRGHDAGEDTVLDLMGYLVLYRIALKRAQQPETAHG